ncbi:hypothetical protein LCGC14_2768890, partial [marine sediment metagenome]
INGANLYALGGASLLLPNADSFTGGILTIDGPGSLDAPLLAAIDNSRFTLSGGAQFRSAATSYSATGLLGNHTLFSASGPGTLLNLSSFESINDTHYTRYYANVHWIRATAGGAIDLSGVTSITSPTEGGDRTDFIVESGGHIDLAALDFLDTRGGPFRFYINTPSFTLPSLTTAESTTFYMRPGSLLDLPLLDSWNGGSMSVPTGGTFQLPELLGVSGVTVSIGQGGTLDVPKLTSFVGSLLYLGANQTLGAPQFENIDNSRFYLTGGVNFSVAATSYSATGLVGNYTPFSAEGSGTLLDLSTLQSINDYYYARYNTNVHTIRAASGGQIDLSGVTSITNPQETADRLDFVVESGGQIDITALETTEASSGAVRFAINDSEFALPKLTLGENLTFAMQIGATVDLPLLQTWDRGSI